MTALRTHPGLPRLSYKAGLHPNPPGTGQGVMVALTIPPDVAEQIAQPGGLTPDDLHVTLVYVGKANEIEDVDADALISAMEDVAGRWAPVEGQVSGIGRFGNGDPDDGDAVWAPFDAAELPELRAAVLSAVLDAGADPPSGHGFTAHVTLGYVDADEPGIPIPVVPPTKVTVPALTVWWASRRVDVPLVGADVGSLL